jgi:CBS-domain-containing membrane protein
MKPPALPAILTRALGGGLAIALMIALSQASGHMLMAIPFATSIVMVMGSPDAPPAQPWRIVGGHLICAACGIAATTLLGFDMYVAALAVGVAMALMLVLDALHPPAGISPLIIAATHATPEFILSPVLTGALILLACAWVFHRLSGETWPHHGS